MNKLEEELLNYKEGKYKYYKDGTYELIDGKYKKINNEIKDNKYFLNLLLEEVDYKNEDSIYYYLGCSYLINKLMSSITIPFNNEYYKEILFSDKNKIIEWSKKEIFPILKEEKEIIKRENWNFKELQGATEKQLYNNDFDIIRNYLIQNFKPNSKVAILSLCSFKKPYSQQKVIKYYVNLTKQKGFDYFVLSNPGIIPIDYDNYYPFRYYNWNEAEETEEIKIKYEQFLQNRIEEWFNKFKEYTDIISIVRPGESYDALNKANIKQNKHLIFSEDFIQQINHNYLEKFKGNKGVLKARMMVLKDTSNKFINILNQF